MWFCGGASPGSGPRPVFSTSRMTVLQRRHLSVSQGWYRATGWKGAVARQQRALSVACGRRRPVAFLHAARDASARRLPPVPPRHRGAAPGDGDDRAAARAAARRARAVLAGHADRLGHAAIGHQAVRAHVARGRACRDVDARAARRRGPASAAARSPRRGRGLAVRGEEWPAGPARFRGRARPRSGRARAAVARHRRGDVAPRRAARDRARRVARPAGGAPGRAAGTASPAPAGAAPGRAAATAPSGPARARGRRRAGGATAGVPRCAAASAASRERPDARRPDGGQHPRARRPARPIHRLRGRLRGPVDVRTGGDLLLRDTRRSTLSARAPPGPRRRGDARAPRHAAQLGRAPPLWPHRDHDPACRPLEPVGLARYAVAALRTRGPREELVRRLGIEPRTYWLRDPNRFGRRGRDLPQFPAFTISKSPGRWPGPTVQPAASVTVHPSPDSVEPLVWNGVVRCKTASLVSTSTPLVAVSVPHAGLARYSMTTMPTAGIGVAPVLFWAELVGRGGIRTGPSTKRALSLAIRA